MANVIIHLRGISDECIKMSKFLKNKIKTRKLADLFSQKPLKIRNVNVTGNKPNLAIGF
jgi:hypothetical protein